MKIKLIIYSIFLLSSVIICDAQIKPPYIKNPGVALPVFDNNAKILHCKYWSEIWQKEIGYLIYLPNDYFVKEDTLFPVYYYLHGYSGNYAAPGVKFDRWNENMDSLLPQIVIVAVNAIDESYYDNNSEESIITELIPHIISTYRVSDQNGCTVIGGFSMGGHGAIKLALMYSHIFSQSLSLSGGHFDGIKNFINEYKTNGTGTLRIRVTVGKTDQTALSHTQTLKTELEIAEIPFYYKEYDNLAHDGTKIFNDSLIRTETFLWQAENIAETCPVATRSSIIPKLTEEQLPYVDEFNPFHSDVKSIFSDKIDIYPNPAYDYFEISYQAIHNTFPVTMKLIDICGNELITKSESLQNQLRIDTSNLQSGVYFLFIYNNDTIVEKEKIIIY